MHWYQESLKGNMANQPEKENQYYDNHNNLAVNSLPMVFKTLTSLVIQCLSLKPIARPPLEIMAIQKTLTQLKGRMAVHLKG